MVDLSLASSYVPAFVCISKCLACTILAFWLVPIGGLSVLCVALLLDRVMWNCDFIIDVNAAVAAVLWAEFAAHERSHHGVPGPVALTLSTSWALLATTQVARPRMGQRGELLWYALLAALLTCTLSPQEPLAYRVARTLCYAATVLVQIYWQLSTQAEEPLVLSLLRHASILAASPLVAAAACVAPNIAVAVRWRPAPSQPAIDPDVEAAALREALASRKEKAGN